MGNDCDYSAMTWGTPGVPESGMVTYSPCDGKVETLIVRGGKVTVVPSVDDRIEVTRMGSKEREYISVGRERGWLTPDTVADVLRDIERPRRKNWTYEQGWHPVPDLPWPTIWWYTWRFAAMLAWAGFWWAFAEWTK